MASKHSGPSTSVGASVKCKRTALTLVTKLEIINRAESGEGASALGQFYNLGECRPDPCCCYSFLSSLL